MKIKIKKYIIRGNSGLKFDALKIVQNINNTPIKITATSELLATLNSVTANFLNAEYLMVES